MFFVRAAAIPSDLRVSSTRGSAGPIAHSMMKGSVKRLSAIFGGSEKSMKKGSQANVACSGADLGDVALLRAPSLRTGRRGERSLRNGATPGGRRRRTSGQAWLGARQFQLTTYFLSDERGGRLHPQRRAAACHTWLEAAAAVLARPAHWPVPPSQLRAPRAASLPLRALS